MGRRLCKISVFIYTDGNPPTHFCFLSREKTRKFRVSVAIRESFLRENLFSPRYYYYY